MKKKEAQMKKRIAADKARMETLKANAAKKLIEQKKLASLKLREALKTAKAEGISNLDRQASRLGI